MALELLKSIEQKLLKGENITVMFVGDSITWGLNHCTDEETYCAEIARLFSKRFPQTTVIRYDGIMQNEALPIERYSNPVFVNKSGTSTITVVRSGVPGDSVKRALDRSDDYTGKFINGEYPELVFTMFGINDALNDPKKHVEPDVFYQQYKQLCELIKQKNPSGKIILMTPTYNDHGITKESKLDKYSDMVKKLACDCGYMLIDTNRLWLEHLVIGSFNKGQREWLSDIEMDCCHFSPEGSRKTAEFIFNNL